MWGCPLFTKGIYYNESNEQCDNGKKNRHKFPSLSSHLFWTELVRGIHEVGADHWEDDGEAVLGRKFHALFELVLKVGCVKTVSRKNKDINLTNNIIYLFTQFPLLSFGECSGCKKNHISRYLI